MTQTICMCIYLTEGSIQARQCKASLSVYSIQGSYYIYSLKVTTKHKWKYTVWEATHRIAFSKVGFVVEWKCILILLWWNLHHAHYIH